ncbi:MAG: DUF368 domain-containing protein [Ruminococcaceae bacterium]|nr:DUF368 domain-containing protein [Oscillospiraceae bacterium]
MDRFWKGIVVGFGGIAPGLSGSVLLIIFGLYRKTLDSLGNLFRNFWKNVRFLLPLVAGMILGVLLFSKLIDFLLAQYEMPTRFCFLGLILGTLPMIWQEVKKRRHFLEIYGDDPIDCGVGLVVFCGQSPYHCAGYGADLGPRGFAGCGGGGHGHYSRCGSGGVFVYVWPL